MLPFLKEILNPKGHQNRITGSKVTAIWLNGWILPIGGASSGRVLKHDGQFSKKKIIGRYDKYASDCAFETSLANKLAYKLFFRNK